MKPLDIVRTPKGALAIVTETNNGGTSASIDYFRGQDDIRERNAWWEDGELVVVDSLPRVLAHAMKHPFGSGESDVEKFFPVTERVK